MVPPKFEQAWNWKTTSGPKFEEIRLVILFLIAINGPVYKRQIENSAKPKIDHPRINKAVKQLLREKLIKIHHRENDGMIKYYALTPAGLMRLIPAISSSGYPNGGLAKKHHEMLPEIFDLWPKFVQANVEDIASKKLEKYCTLAFEEERRKLMVGKVRVEKRQLLDEFFLGSFPDDDLMVGGVRNRDRWLKALRSDKALCGAAIEACRSRVASFSKEAEGFSGLIEARGNEFATAGFREGLRRLNASLSGV
jgi:DNA-binding PadR family transcriptional regulator